MYFHDPRQVIEDIRNHLAAHDRRISFFFGAGSSCSVNVAPAPLPGKKQKYTPLIPGINALTESCKISVSELGEKYAESWEKLIQECETDKVIPNVENILSKVRVKIDAIGEEGVLIGLNKDELVEIEINICSTIAKLVNPSEDEIPEITPHTDFSTWIKKINRSIPIEIFTTNYDILLERALEVARVPVYDGFVGSYKPFFYPECFNDEEELPKSKWVRLWKLHGSVNWGIENTNRGVRIVRGHPTNTGELILPSHRKYDESRKQPYIAYLDRLAGILNHDHVLMIVCGYSFGDEHINSIIYNALENNSTVNIIALQFDSINKDNDLVKMAKQFSNLSVIGPNAGVISGKHGSWKLTQAVDNKLSQFMDIGFDSNAEPEEKGSSAFDSEDLKGEMRLGDFIWFSKFLHSMNTEFYE